MEKNRVNRITALVLLTVVLLFVAGSVLSIRSVNALLDRDASLHAKQWADTFAVQVKNADQILEGGTISDEDRRLFEKIASVGDVFRFKLFASDGTLRLVSDELEKTGKAESLQDHRPAIAAAIMEGKVYTEVKDGSLKPNRPDVYAEAYVPLVQEGKVKGVIEVYVDQTERREAYGTTLWRTIWIALALTVLAIGHSIYTAWLIHRERASDELARHLAVNDGLTGVPNRTHFYERIALALGSRRRDSPAISALIIDLDGFKAVNDSHGHSVGDALLREVSNQLLGELDENDLLARLGGDEFAVLQSATHNPRDTDKLANRLRTVIGSIKEVDGFGVRVSASIGFACSKDLPAGAGADDLIKRADIALYVAKASGRDRAVAFEDDMQDLIIRRSMLRERVREAVKSGELVLLYQPQHDAENGKLSGFEALVRLPDGFGNFIPPDEFIPIAEELHLMEDLGFVVLDKAMHEAMNWPDHLRVAVNLSAQQFEGDIVPIVEKLLDRSGLRPDRLELEITESLFIADTEQVEAQLMRLKKLGVRIAMDDFGTGYSSLSYLWQFPFDKLKIDRSCFQLLGTNSETSEKIGRIGAVLNTIGAMGNAMNLRVTAEGIETWEQFAYARRAGYHEIQGFLYGRPMPAEDLPAHILGDFSRENFENEQGYYAAGQMSTEHPIRSRVL